MASIIRPAVVRHTCIANPARTFSTRISTSLPTANKSSILKNSTRNGLTKDVIPGPIRVAAFHTSSQRQILPPLPQVVEGTANDPAPTHPPNPSHGSYHWTFERLVAAGCLPLTIAPFAAGSLNPTMDAILCATILIHSHIGFESCIIDYVPRKRLPNTRLVFWWGLRAATVLVGVGLYEFETNDVGVTEAIKRIWKA